MPKGDKYIALTNYLKDTNREIIKLSFKEIEQIIGEKLSKSAYNYHEFWSNTTSHSIAFGWFNAGYKKKFVDISNEYVIFEKDSNDKFINENYKLEMKEVFKTSNLLKKDINKNFTLSMELADKSIRKFLEKILEDENSRYLSWDHCFKAFQRNANKTNNEILDFLALNLAFYLASWGMYRGSSFLLQKDYKIHIPTIKILQEKRYENLRAISAKNLLLDSNLKLLEEISERISSVYAVAKPSFDDKINKVTDTLVTKILLGTYGCVPAYDRFYKKAVKKYNISSPVFNKESIKSIANYCCANYSQFEKLKKEISFQNRLKIEYPDMKLMDMCMWQIGRDLDEEDK